MLKLTATLATTSLTSNQPSFSHILSLGQNGVVDIGPAYVNNWQRFMVVFVFWVYVNVGNCLFLNVLSIASKGKVSAKSFFFGTSMVWIIICPKLSGIWFSFPKVQLVWAVITYHEAGKLFEFDLKTEDDLFWFVPRHWCLSHILNWAIYSVNLISSEKKYFYWW